MGLGFYRGFIIRGFGVSGTLESLGVFIWVSGCRV